MRKQLTKADAEFQMFSDFYKMYQDFYIPEDSDEYWEQLADAVEAFCKKYASKFAKELAFDYIDSREAIYRLKSA